MLIWLKALSKIMVILLRDILIFKNEIRKFIKIISLLTTNRNIKWNKAYK